MQIGVGASSLMSTSASFDRVHVYTDLLKNEAHADQAVWTKLPS